MTEMRIGGSKTVPKLFKPYNFKGRQFQKARKKSLNCLREHRQSYAVMLF